MSEVTTVSAPEGATSSGTVTVNSPAPASVPAQTPAQASWHAGFKDLELRGYIENKGFQDPEMVAKSYRQLEKNLGAPPERLLKLPERSDAPEWNDIYSKLGKPAKPEEYGLKPKEGDTAFGEWAEKTFHGANLTKDQAKVLAQNFEAFQKQAVESQNKALAQKLDLQEIALKQEWGAAFDHKILEVKKGVHAFGIDAPTVDALEQALGFDKTMKLLSKLGEKVGEDSFVSAESGQKGGFKPMTPHAAQEQINSLMKDKDFVSKYLNGNIEAKERMEHLNKMAVSFQG